jgi:hypothetical protein
MPTRIPDEQRNCHPKGSIRRRACRAAGSGYVYSAMNESESRGDRAAEGCQRSAGASGACWRLPLLLAVVLAAIVIVNGRGVRRERAGTGTAAPAISADGENQKTVSLVIDLPAGARSSNGIP